jgi:hypothetical protein
MLASGNTPAAKRAQNVNRTPRSGKEKALPFDSLPQAPSLPMV